MGKCPDLSRKFSQRCPPDTIDQCKYDEDCTENNKQKCCKIGCGKICFNPGDLALISGKSVINLKMILFEDHATLSKNVTWVTELKIFIAGILKIFL